MLCWFLIAVTKLTARLFTAAEFTADKPITEKRTTKRNDVKLLRSVRPVLELVNRVFYECCQHSQFIQDNLSPLLYPRLTHYIYAHHPVNLLCFYNFPADVKDINVLTQVQIF